MKLIEKSRLLQDNRLIISEKEIHLELYQTRMGIQSL